MGGRAYRRRPARHLRDGRAARVARRARVGNRRPPLHAHLGALAARRGSRGGRRRARIAGGTARLFLGAGIVEGSSADSEWMETQLKARALLDALEGAA